ncbi:MAG: riboflavin synthase [Planctomycetota bacterium]
MMFTGIVQKVARVRSVHSKGSSSTLGVRLEDLHGDIQVGDSVMIDGVCLTATHLNGDTWEFDVSSETLRRSTLGNLHNNSRVNVELAMQPTDRFGGHFVSGHVDGTAQIRQLSDKPGEKRLIVKADSELTDQMIMKGSVAVDGISLTIADLSSETFEVSLIPQTLETTTLSNKKVGDNVNVECDMIGKWIRKFTQSDHSDSEGLSMEQLKENGY